MMIDDIIQKSFLLILKLASNNKAWFGANGGRIRIFGLWVINVTEYHAILLQPVDHNFVNVFLMDF